jgi:hypothetical protein
MAQPTDLFDRYDGTNAVRESLSDIIYNISPEETPFMSNIGKGTAKQTYNEWQTDALAAASTSNAHIDGDDSALEARTGTVRQGNYTQISKKVIGVSGTLEATDKAGIKSYMAYEMAKAGSELKIDMESILLNRQVAVAGDSSTARTLAGLPNWYAANSSVGATGVNGVYSGGTTSGTPTTDRVEGTQRAFTETILKDVVQQIWSSGGKVKMLMVGPFNKQAVSAFAGLASARFNVSSAKKLAIIATADIYLSDFGELSIVPNRFQRERDAHFIDPEFLQVDYLRNFKTEDLAKTGDSTKKQMIVEYSLRVKNEAAHGIAADLSAS